MDLEEFLKRQGETLLPSGHEKRMTSNHSVTIRGSRWYDHATERGGGPVSFVREFYGLGYADAVSLLLGGEHGTPFPTAKDRVEEPPKPFALPERSTETRRVYAYLMKCRGIDREVISHFVRAGLLYEDAKYHNCVFVGTDREGIPRHAHKRSTNSEGKVFRINVEGGDPKYSFHHIGNDGSLFVFEAPIDLLSYLSLYPENWQEHNYVACCGTSSLPVIEMLEEMDHPAAVYLCLDNDKAGHKASLRMAELIGEHFGIASDRLLPEHKDWNDDLIASKDQKEVEQICPAVCGG